MSGTAVSTPSRRPGTSSGRNGIMLKGEDPIGAGQVAEQISTGGARESRVVAGVSRPMATAKCNTYRVTSG